MKVLNIGADPFPPYQYINSAGKLSGEDYITIKSVIDRMPYEGKFIIKEWSIIENMFENKKLDIIFQIQKTPYRIDKYYFSSKLRDAVTSIIASQDIQLENYNNLKEILVEDFKLGVLKDYQYGENIDSIDTAYKLYFDSLDDLITALNCNKLKFGVVDLGVFHYLTKENSYDNIKIADKFNFVRPLYIAFNDPSIRDEFENHSINYKN